MEAVAEEQDGQDAEDATEERLSELEARTAALTARVEKLRPILADAEKRAELVAEKEAFEESTKDPKRLLSRGGGSLM